MGSTKNLRMKWLDFCKGFAIIFVIVGHSISFKNYIGDSWRNLIYSFHMPLFFVLSGVTIRPSLSSQTFLRKIKINSKSLLGLTLFIVSVRAIHELFSSPSESLSYWLIKKMASVLFSSGVRFQFLGRSIPALGMMWFLVVLFFLRLLMDFLLQHYSLNKVIVFSVIFSGTGVLISKYTYLPFSLDIVLTSSIFFILGYYLKQRNHSFSLNDFLLSVLVWLPLTFVIRNITGTYFEFATRSYPLYPISFINAGLGVVAIISLSQILPSDNFVYDYLSRLGRYSIIIFTIHALDYIVLDYSTLTNSIFLNILLRVLFNILVFELIMWFRKNMNGNYFIKKS